MSTNVTAHLDAESVDRANELLPIIRDNIDDPEAPISHVYAGAVRVGLNRLTSPKRIYTADDYEPQQVVGGSNVVIPVEDDDITRADAIATALSVTRATVVSAAAATGLAMLVGIDTPITGPFTS